MRIVFAGSSGFLGGHLRARLAADGHDLVQLVRRPPSGPNQHQWWPERGELDPAALAGTDAVINLAGLGIEDKRWNDTVKRELVASRVDPTGTLARTLAAMPSHERPRALLNASAIGYYGHTGDSTVDETGANGAGFFPDLCRHWEDATEPADAAGVRVVHLRTGLVLDGSGGLLRPFLLAFKAFVGGPLAGGRWWMSWISMRDWTSAVAFLLASDIAGPVNLCGPDPVRNIEFTRALARVLHRPALFPVPTIGLRILLGEFATEAVADLRVAPSVLLGAGFTYADTDIESALRTALA